LWWESFFACFISFPSKSLCCLIVTNSLFVLKVFSALLTIASKGLGWRYNPKRSLLSKKKVHWNLSSTLLNFSSFLNEKEILWVGGYLNYGPFSLDVKHLKILPHDHPITILLVMR
jgi:hypothetical protein